MHKKNLGRRLLAGILSAAMILGGLTLSTPVEVEAAVQTSTLTVDMAAETGDILHGASGFLYGISNEDVPTTNTLVPLKPKVLATKGALGTEHPYGDALDVAETFLSSGGEQVMMYNSNYYGVFGVTANYRDYSNVLKNILAPHIYQWKQDWKAEHGTPDAPKDELGKIDIDAAIIYIPINEGTPVNGASNTNVAWKAYYDAIKAGDPDATIAGPNSASYGSQFMNTNFRSHMQYCADNDCMPDIITWHELQTGCLNSMSAHMDDFRNIWKGINWTKWLQTHDEIIEMPQIVINEYAEMKDCGVPGALVNWIARLEDEKIYGCLPFWQQANNLNGLTSDANEGAGAWWVYKWYGDMSGQTLEVETSTSYDRLYGVAAIDENKQSASVLMGGEDGNQKLLLENLDDTAIFKDEEIVHVSVQKAAYNGYAGTVSEVPTILEGNFPVADNGSVEITIPDTKFADAFYVTITKSNDAESNDPLVSRYSATYEAEEAQFEDLYVQQIANYNPTYYFSDGYVVLMDEEDCELTYEIEVPVDGKYQLNFLYGNGTGSSRNDMYNHKPLNVKQSYQIDGGKSETVIMENTLFTAITDCYTKYVDLKAGKHTITITSLEDADVIHDALTVTYAGAYNVAQPAWSDVYEAEQADFNALADCEKSQVLTKTDIAGYSGNGYVTGLNAVDVVNGGGIRWNVVVEESGIYNFTLRYQASKSGKANIYIGNTTTTLDSLSKTVDLSSANNAWKTVVASIYLQKGINIVDVDVTVDAALDYMKVQKVPESSLTEGKSVVIEAEDCIPEGSAIAVANSEGASSGKYVVGYEGNENAESDVNKYLEFTYDAPQAGIYELQIFQSNDDICGSHSYNIKIIDKYASVQVKNANGAVTEESRYFFINTSSNDTFKEKTVQVQLEKGKNTLKIFNDDSWHVTWGGSTWEPGLNELDNYTPNFDKFVLTPMTLEKAAQVEAASQIQIQTTAGGYAAADKNEVASGESAVISIYPEKGIDKVYVNGTDESANVKQENGLYTLTISNITEDQLVEIYFSEGSGEYIDPYITNASFATKDLTGWTASAASTKVNNASADSYEGYYAEITEGTLKQTVTGIPTGDYNLCLYSKAKTGANISGQAVLKAQNQTLPLMSGTTYEENILRVSVGETGVLDIEIDASELNGTICLDYFVLEEVQERDMSLVDELTAYFVDCGDHNPSTLSAGDLFGLNNSVTDQIYSADRSTGYYWGVVTSEEDYAMSRGEKGVYTNYQWAHEWDTSDGLAKTASFRYAHGQDTAGINQRYVKYRFELEPAEYSVSVCMGNTWGNAGNPDIYLNDTQISAANFTVAANSNAVASGRIDLSQAEVNENGHVVLDVYALSTDATIQMNYITIAEYREFADMSKLQASYDAVKGITDDGYMANSWADFQNALKAAEAFLKAENIPYARQLEVNAARAALDTAFASLVKISDVQDPELLYFVDCGDHNPSTLTRKDKFGIYNSVTDQIYGPDAASGKSWGVVTSESDVKINAERASDKGVYTTYQRANQNSDAEAQDGQDKKITYRYAHGQDTAGISPRYVKYQFELSAGTYEVEVCMGNNWGNSGNPDVYLNDIKINDTDLGIGQGSNKVVIGKITLAEGEELLVAALSQDPTINMNYIKIREDVAPEPGVDKTALQAAVDATAVVGEESDYTAETWAVYAKALADAEAVLADDDATQEEVDAAYEALDAAYTGLTLKDEEPDPTPDPDPEPTPTPDPDPDPTPIPEVLADFNFDADGDAFVGGAAKATGTYSLVDHAGGKALKLDGNGQFLTLTTKDGASLLTGVDELTVSFQFNPESSATNWGFFAAPNTRQQQYQSEKYIGVFDNNGAIGAERYYSNNEARPANPSTQAGYGSWYHVTVVFTATETILYLNGEEKAREASIVDISDLLGENSVAYIGKSTWLSSGEYYTGLMDNFKLYSRVLTAEEIEKEAAKYIDKTALTEAIAAAEKITNKDDYTPGTWEAFEAALTAAKAVAANEEATQTMINDAASALTSAQSSLREKANMAELQAKVDEAEKLESDKYTEETWAKVVAEIEDAKEVLANAEARQTAVDSALRQLNNAIEALELKEDEPDPTPTPTPGPDPFQYDDVSKEDWFHDAAYYTHDKGIITGLEETTFGPYVLLSRAQFAVILHRLAGTPEVETDKSFPDVAGDEWYGQAVLWAAEAGIVNGYENGNFGPADNITREQMALMMYRYANYLEKDITNEGDLSKFQDAASVSGFAEEAMKWATDKGIITGKGSEEPKALDPQGNTARAEAAAIIQRFMAAYAE